MKSASVKNILVISFILLVVSCPPVRVKARENFTVGYGISNFEYREPSMTESGTLQHLRAKYERFTRHTFCGLEGNIWAGNLTYNGETLETDPTAVTAETDDLILDTSFRFGYPRSRRSEVFIPYFGLGFRFWQNIINQTGSTVRTERATRYLYSPIGFLHATRGGRLGNSIFKIEYLYFWSGTVNTNTPITDEWENNQNRGKGGRVSLSFLFEERSRVSHSLTFYLHYWDIEPSDLYYTGTDIDGDGTKDSVYEPANETISLGAQLNINF